MKIDEIALLLGIYVVIAAFVMMVVILLMRITLIRRLKWRKKTYEKWRDLIYKYVRGEISSFPRIPRSRLADFMILWNRMADTIEAQYRYKLRDLGRELGFPVIAERFLHTGNIARKLLGMLTLGNLVKRDVLHDLWIYISHYNSSISLAAARSMLKIDPEFSLPILIPLFGIRDDWASTMVASILKGLDHKVVSEQIAFAALGAHSARAVKLVRYLEIIDDEVSSKAVREILLKSKEEEVISVCLQIVHNRKNVDQVHKYLENPVWFLRVQAVNALGRIGTDEDESLLVERLKDGEWWVRYRAAQALTKLPSFTIDRFDKIRNNTQDRYARDIITQVQQEVSLS